MNEAPTEHDLFERFKAAGLNVSWTDHLQGLWAEEIRFYMRNGFHLIAIGKNAKVPVQGTPWKTAARLTEEEALEYAANGKNLAVVAGFSGLVILDVDEEIKMDGCPTLAMRSPRGYAFFTREPFDPDLWRDFEKRHPEFDAPRKGILYQLVPLSKTCVNDHGESHDCKRHDYRVRTWMDRTMPIIPFAEFVKDFG
jgi:hypothetical protein